MQKLSRCQMIYLNIPHSTTGISSVELFLKRKNCIRLELVRPSVGDHVAAKPLKKKRHHDRHLRKSEF